MVLSCLSVRVCVRLCVRPEILLTQYLAEYLTHFHQIYNVLSYVDAHASVSASPV